MLSKFFDSHYVTQTGEIFYGMGKCNEKNEEGTKDTLHLNGYDYYVGLYEPSYGHSNLYRSVVL